MIIRNVMKTAMRDLLKRTHPDFFQDKPYYKEINQESLVKLQRYFKAYFRVLDFVCDGRKKAVKDYDYDDGDSLHLFKDFTVLKFGIRRKDIVGHCFHRFYPISQPEDKNHIVHYGTISLLELFSKCQVLGLDDSRALLMDNFLNGLEESMASQAREEDETLGKCNQFYETFHQYLRRTVPKDLKVVPRYWNLEPQNTFHGLLITYEPGLQMEQMRQGYLLVCRWFDSLPNRLLAEKISHVNVGYCFQEPTPSSAIDKGKGKGFKVQFPYDATIKGDWMYWAILCYVKGKGIAKQHYVMMNVINNLI